MKVLVQRVDSASVSVNGNDKASIKKGFLLLVAIEKGDTEEVVKRIAEKVSKLRIFDDAEGKMNLDIKQANGDILSVSQFTLAGDTKKGNRPGFDKAEDPEKAKELWIKFNEFISSMDINVLTGEFAAFMKVKSINDGPVTFIVES